MGAASGGCGLLATPVDAMRDGLTGSRDRYDEQREVACVCLRVSGCVGVYVHALCDRQRLGHSTKLLGETPSTSNSKGLRGSVKRRAAAPTSTRA